MTTKLIQVKVYNSCNKCPFVYYGQFCLKCKAFTEWRDVPVTIEDVPEKCIRPHYIPDWCPFEDIEL